MDKVIASSLFSIMKKPYGDPVVAGFESLTPPVFQVAEQARGFIVRGKVTDDVEHLGNFERDCGDWDAFAVLNYYDDGFIPAEETHAGKLSIWEDIESVHNLTYSGLHGIAFKQRHKWFREIDYPRHVILWINRGETPSWKQSVARYDSLYANWPKALAFNFQQSFDSAGNPLTGFELAR